ncbi:metabotropic glutamate receptor 3-like isoform X2 [Lineus longissimus]|uniref:metabotropic glutamate receptor 3-like isoform X2 n=1 Tax=Lineus longissimus TaxID=88925 RepID=UPI00315D570F
MEFAILCSGIGLLQILLVVATDSEVPNPPPTEYTSNVSESIDISIFQQRETMTYYGKYGNITWPDRSLTAKVEGDLVIGGLMMVHERSEELICGPIMAQGGIQALEMMLFTLDHVNNQKDFLPGIKLGAHIKDDCDRDTYGLEQSVDFIRGSISNIGGGASDCQDGDDNTWKNIVGVVGAASSVTSIQVANLLKLFKIPQVSFFSTSAELSAKERYPYFLRTIPSDDAQAQAMVQLVKMFKWQYVSLLYEESSYGEKGMQVVEHHLKKAGVCIAVRDRLIKDSGVASEDTYDKVVEDLLKKKTARGVIVFGSDQEVAQLMNAVRRNNATGQFVWIGSDGWGGRELVWKTREAQVEGAVTVQPLAKPVKAFDDYFLSLKPDNNTRNPWFIEYWESYFNCKYPDSPYTPLNEDFVINCTDNMTQSYETGYMPEAQLQFVSDAVLAFANAIRNIQRKFCPGQVGLCPKIDPIPGKLLLEELKKVHFRSLSGQDVQFDKNLDGPPRYRILNFQQPKPGEYKWQEVGFFTEFELTLKTTETNDSLLMFRLNEPTFPASYCSAKCGPGQAKYYITGDKCCWNCVNCTRWQYLASEDICRECDYGTKPDARKTTCIEIPPEVMQQDNPIAIAALVYASAGVIVTVFVICVFVLYHETPVVKASGRELSFVLLVGILLSFGMTFFITNKPSDLICGLQKFGIGLCFSICYGAILTKTNRIARIFRAGKRTVRRPKFISPLSQLLICSALVVIQVAIGTCWIIYRPPKAGPHYPTRAQHQLVCKSAVGLEYMIGLGYPVLLIIICTVYAVLTRKIPEAFNESKHIGFTMYTTCIIWLAFVPIYFSTANNIKIRLGTLCFSISLSATIALICLFTPKLYIILLRPERNVRQSMMSSKNVSLSKQNSSHSRVDSAYSQYTELQFYSRARTPSATETLHLDEQRPLAVDECNSDL